MQMPWCRPIPFRNRVSFALALAILSAPALGAGPVAAEEPAEDPSPVLRLTGMTFVGSRGEIRELVLRARSALFRPETRIAELEGVEAEVSEGEGGRSFAMSCLRAELDFDTEDFRAEGQVEGVTGDGQRYSAPWVRYTHAEGVLFTDAPVVMVDGTGSYRGDGFRYHVDERRFQLLGNVRVEQGL